MPQGNLFTLSSYLGPRFQFIFRDPINAPILIVFLIIMPAILRELKMLQN